MKKSLAFICVLIVALGYLVYQAVVLSKPKETPKDISDILVERDGRLYLILPISHQDVLILDSQQMYLERIDLDMLQSAEEKLLDQMDDYQKKDKPHFSIGHHDGQIWLCAELIIYLDPRPVPTGQTSTDPTAFTPPQSGCGIDHDHKIFREPISKN